MDILNCYFSYILICHFLYIVSSRLQLINLYYQAHEKKVKYVMLEGLIHPTKFEKTSQLIAMKEFVLEGHQIALTVLNNYLLLSKIINNKFLKFRSSLKC